ncbi:uncharacterized protein L969DRAFT_17169 [Mixia osmundae IAM 14324]|uniref:RPEL repeat protein n=1 Tax=Mixia osmundae (strain CBS 9802 / IAM 14324 / JCM 22182 / KY 12970) TaxID=764103 RepID=G7DZU3_MIXOS|nr:uncharacterized protein L969DRAFT_17169 [Mixia osmundae IAM 14324]KEI39237.1 hypothetical protein L969DRAFT_17169 [Mixia osmundae IAM 14324]GAA96103.1 hypothetical protein E5Q_02764 [Mixia osmundae IAM 14324]
MSSLQASEAKLESLLKNRPQRDELVDKNILKDSRVAPALQAAEAELARAQAKDTLEAKLQARPMPEELVQEGIAQKGEVGPR